VTKLITIILGVLLIQCDGSKSAPQSDSNEPAPDCSSLIAVAGPDSGASEDLSSLFIPPSCGGSLFSVGVEPSCAVSTDGTVKLGGKEFDLSFACYTEVTLNDITTGLIFNGFFVSLISNNNCNPMVGIFVGDDQRYGDPPYTINLEERLCSVGERRAATVLIRAENSCYIPIVPVEGFLTINELSSGIMSGQLKVRSSKGDGNDIAIELDLKMSYKLANHNHLDMNYSNLCSQ